jgi:hypothetical protein
MTTTPTADMDPHDVLNLPRNFTLEQLRYNYRVLARQLHPDKHCGRLSRDQATAAFQVLTDAYRALLRVHASTTGARGFDELKRTFEDELGGGAGAPAPLHVDAKKFDLARFNTVFNDVRVPDPSADDGYGDWMARHDPDSAGAKSSGASSRTLSTNLDPVAAGLRATAARRGTGGLTFVELGADRIDDFSARLRQIEYTDYKVAHTTTRLVDDEVLARARKEYASLEDLARDRATLSYQPTDADARAAQRARLDEEAREARRLELLNNHDAVIGERYARAHALLLGHAPSA